MSNDNETTFDSFFRSQSDAVLQFCWGLTLDREVARDLGQEVMARAWKNWEQIGGPRAGEESNPAAWCRTVALNLVRGRWRRDRTAAIKGSNRVTHERSEPVDLDLVNAVRRLSEKQREAIVLHHLMDVSVAQCAVEMQVAEATVKTHLQRGRAELASILSDEVLSDSQQTER